MALRAAKLLTLFQSTPPVKAATTIARRTARVSISIHAAREGGDLLEWSGYCKKNISIHAAREGGDVAAEFKIRQLGISIHAAREGGDFSSACSRSNMSISIHAAREGGDLPLGSTSSVIAYFNPRRP